MTDLFSQLRSTKGARDKAKAAYVAKESELSALQSEAQELIGVEPRGTMFGQRPKRKVLRRKLKPFLFPYACAGVATVVFLSLFSVGAAIATGIVIFTIAFCIALALAPSSFGEIY